MSTVFIDNFDQNSCSHPFCNPLLPCGEFLAVIFFSGTRGKTAHHSIKEEKRSKMKYPILNLKFSALEITHHAISVRLKAWSSGRRKLALVIAAGQMPRLSQTASWWGNASGPCWNRCRQAFWSRALKQRAGLRRQHLQGRRWMLKCIQEQEPDPSSWCLIPEPTPCTPCQFLPMSRCAHSQSCVWNKFPVH